MYFTLYEEEIHIEEHLVLGEVSEHFLTNSNKGKVKLLKEEEQKRKIFYDSGKSLAFTEDVPVRIVEEFDNFLLFLYEVKENNYVWFTALMDFDYGTLVSVSGFRNEYEKAKADFLERSGKLIQENPEEKSIYQQESEENEGEN